MMTRLSNPLLSAISGACFVTYCGGFLLIGYIFGEAALALSLFVSICVGSAASAETWHRFDCSNDPYYAEQMKREGKFRV